MGNRLSAIDNQDFRLLDALEKTQLREVLGGSRFLKTVRAPRWPSRTAAAC